MYLAGTFPLREGLIAMGLYHAAIGVIEAVITVLALNLIMNVRPDLMDDKVKVPNPKGVTA
jgi:cobalt/nickel transport system permease protein